MLTLTPTRRQLDVSYTGNRELSWLKFNERVLQIASDPSVPILERMKFVSIFTSNLDEFYMIRVGSLFDLSIIDESHLDNKSGMTVREQLEEIFKAVPALYGKRDKVFHQLESELGRYGIKRLSYKELEPSERKFIDTYFERVILPVLAPQVVDPHHPFPHIENKSLNIAVMLRAGNETKFGIIPLPKIMPRIVFLKNSQTRYMLAEDIILTFTEKIFEMYSVQEKTVISITRNADINPDDESLDFEEDFRHHMKKILKKRARLSAVRLEMMEGRTQSLASYLRLRLLIDENQVYQSRSPIEMSYVYALEEKLPVPLRRAVSFHPYVPQCPLDIEPGESMMKLVSRQDVFLSYPYESMEPFLQLVKEAASDPSVISINITLYRLGKKSHLVESLIDAAENKKDVTVIMELRARFDEQNNIEWAERLEEAGCKVIYGFAEYKVHSKICLITRHERNRIQYITQIGTGNYNEKTSKLYCDFSLITANDRIGSDANAFFKNMLLSNLDGKYQELLVAPTWLKSKIFLYIDGEIEKAKKGQPCGIILKMNSLTDRETIDKLSEASCAGVRIKLIIRGICCIVPGIEGKTENIAVTSILGRFLEHSRIYCFGSGDDAAMYISSADMMTRNVERRIEVACPVLDPKIKSRILDLLSLQSSENAKAWTLDPDNQYRVRQYGQVDCQQYYMQEAEQAAARKTHRQRTDSGRTTLLARLLKNISPVNR